MSCGLHQYNNINHAYDQLRYHLYRSVIIGPQLTFKNKREREINTLEVLPCLYLKNKLIAELNKHIDEK